MAETVGFEPTCPCGQLDFESSSLRPLRYISIKSNVPIGTYFKQTYVCFFVFLSKLFFAKQLLRITYISYRSSMTLSSILSVTSIKLNSYSAIDIKPRTYSARILTPELRETFKNKQSTPFLSAILHQKQLYRKLVHYFSRFDLLFQFCSIRYSRKQIFFRKLSTL